MSILGLSCIDSIQQLDILMLVFWFFISQCFNISAKLILNILTKIGMFFLGKKTNPKNGPLQAVIPIRSAVPFGILYVMDIIHSNGTRKSMEAAEMAHHHKQTPNLIQIVVSKLDKEQPRPDGRTRLSGFDTFRYQ
jgi:hypothetical protein